MEKVQRKPKARRRKKRKIRWDRVILLLVILILLIFVIVKIVSKKNDNQEESLQTGSEGVTNEMEVEQVIEPTEDEDIKQLVNNIMTEKGLTENNFAFFYYNQDTKKYYFYNENKYFTAASTVKVPVAMLYYDKINSGKLTLESTLKYTKDCYEAGGGTTASTYKVGSNIPIGFLLEQAIVNSDNTAVNILIKNLGWDQYRVDMTKYTDEEVQPEFYDGNVTFAGYGYDLLTYLYNNKDSYPELIENMKKSSGGQYLKKYITQYDVAHKYGSYNGNVHDYGIVFGETTYLIGVYTKGVTSADELIADISQDVLNTVEGTDDTTESSNGNVTNETNTEV